MSFQIGTINSISSKAIYNWITINHVLYLLPPRGKRKVVNRAYALLKFHGKLFIKFNPRSFSVRYFLTWLQEILTVKLLKQTVSKHHGLYFEGKCCHVNNGAWAVFYKYLFQNVSVAYVCLNYVNVV